jgi:hypothetical protein
LKLGLNGADLEYSEVRGLSARCGGYNFSFALVRIRELANRFLLDVV